MNPSAHVTRLVADIGGTNSRLALFDAANGELRGQRNYINSEHEPFGDIVALWLDTLNEPAPTQCCLAVAAPPFDDVVRMVNIDWRFSLGELAARFGFGSIGAINDFVANAYALPHLPARDIVTLRPGDTSPDSRLATVGPGTGLGGCTLDRSRGAHTAAPSEPGHMGLAPATALESELFAAVLGGPGEVYAEYLLSGPGLVRLYEGMARLEGRAADALSPADVTRRALAGDDPTCVHSLQTFCALLGSACGDFVLCNGAFGGLYLAGGIVPRLVDFLGTSDFTARFEHKGKMREHLHRVPLHVITGGTAGLIGAGHAPVR